MTQLSSAKRRRISLKAIELFKDYLFVNNRRLIKSLEINLKFEDLADAMGICDAHDIGIKPREFTILINRNLRDEKTVISTVAHEMVHVWQYATGKLRDYEAPVHRYENDLYDADMNYKEMPWEIEARNLEKVLYQYWLKKQ